MCDHNLRTYYAYDLVEALYSILAKEGVDTLEALLACKLDSVVTEEDIKAWAKDAKLTKKDAHSFVIAFRGLDADTEKRLMQPVPARRRTSLLTLGLGLGLGPGSSELEMRAPAKRLDPGAPAAPADTQGSFFLGAVGSASRHEAASTNPIHSFADEIPPPMEKL